MELDYQAERLRSASQQLAPIRPDYANLPVEEGFNWSSSLADVPFSRLYLVVFRSVRRETADLEKLREYDDLAYAEAREAGGLLHYFKGQTNERRACLSFCLWESMAQARAAAGGSSHGAAAKIWTEMYEVYELERYFLTRDAGGNINFEPVVTDHVRAGAVAPYKG